MAFSVMGPAASVSTGMMMMPSRPWEMKFSTWPSWTSAFSWAATMVTSTPASLARASMPSATVCRNWSRIGNVTPILMTSPSAGFTTSLGS